MAEPAARILIVDDEYDQMKALCDTLGDSGYETTGRTDGQSALAALRESRFDLLLTDLMMPDMSGIALLRRALEIDPSLFGIIMTGQGTIETAVEAMKTGAFDFILKPFKLSAILAMMARALAVRKLRLENASLQVGLRQRSRELETANRELREIQGQLVRAAKMASLGELVVGVADEIDNPLGCVANHREACERNLEGVIREQLSSASRPELGQLRVHLRDMTEALQRIRDLVAKLRTFSRLDGGEIEPVDIAKCVESVLLLLHHRLGDRIMITRRYGSPNVVRCSPGPMSQVMMNVIANAIDAIEDRGEIIISTGRDGSKFFISIADTGKGIPKAIQDRVLEPFFTTKPAERGTGLGLAISHNIVKRHEGTLEVRSEEGEGTEVVIALPLEQADRAGGV